jgi:hypothetical protein
MWRHKIRLSLGCLLAVLVLASTGIPTASAVTSGGNGLRISPVRTDLTISPGQSKTLTFNVTNVTAAPATLQGIVNDFTASADESGNPAIILNPNAYASSHSLKRFVAPINNFTLQAGQEQNVTVTINIPAGTAGGGYYGAVRFAPAVSAVNPGQNLSLAGSVGSLILVSVPGNIKEQLTIASFDARVNGTASSFFTSNKHINATVRFQNEGNIQEAPFGKILLKSRSGKVLADYEINNTSPPGNILPDSIRRFSIPLNKVGSFGEFKLEGNFGYGVNGQLLSASTTFYVIPLWLIVAFIVVVLLLAFLIFGLPRLIRAYNRQVLRKAGRR